MEDPVGAQKQFSVADFEVEPSPPARDERSWGIVELAMREFADEKFICGPSGGEVGIVFLGDSFGVGGGGMERGLIALIEQPEVVRAATAYLLKRQNLADEVMIHPNQDAVLWGIDFGQKSGPFISPRMFSELFLEANRERVARIHARGLRVIKHSCGSNRGLLDYFVEIGYDCYQSIQPTAGMDICEIKQSHGDKLALWGGVGVEHLVSGTPEQVREDVRRAMACAKPGGGFILGSSHSIAVGTKYDNFMAMLDEHHKLAAY
jgi:uroporphyrinogen-III decarboxylase